MEPDAVTFLSHGLVVYLLAPVIILLLVSIHKESRGENPLKRDSMVWCSDDGAVRYCYSLYDTSSSDSFRENQSNRNRLVTGSMISLRDLQTRQPIRIQVKRTPEELGAFLSYASAI